MYDFPGKQLNTSIYLTLFSSKYKQKLNEQI